MRNVVCLAASLLCLVLSLNTFAQTANATLGGTVSDSTGALIPGVTVTATNTGTGVVTTVLSNESGSYQFPPLQPGTYKVSAELAGFQTVTYSDVALGLNQTVRLNVNLQVGGLAQSVEVSVAADTLLATTTSSVGAVLPEYKVRDLPLINRDVLDLVGTTAGVRGSVFAGAPAGMAMTTRDGINVNDGRYANGIYSATFVSSDLVEEVRVIVSPADAEFGRGSGQVQLSTRSGTNQFRGALFWTNRNSVLDANTSTNNFNGNPKDYVNRNQFGGRFGGPIIRNKTFFFFLYEGMRTVQKAVATATVFTETARNGIYRFYPGVQSANANALTPTVDLAGNPARPANATGNLVSFDVFTRDPLRPGPDPSGMVQRLLARMPLPNNFQTGDGLNTAGHRYVRRTIGNETFTGTGDNVNRNQANLRIDHNFNSSHKLYLVASRERTNADDALASWPGGYNGAVIRHPQVYTANFVSTLSPTLVNEARFGLRRGRVDNPQAYDVPSKSGQEAKKFLGNSNGIPFIVEGSLFGSNNIFNDSNGSIGNTSPLWTLGDNVSWTRGRHAFKSGAEYRIGSTNAWNSDEIVPNVHLGGATGTTGGRDYFCAACGIAVTGIDNVAFSGMQNTDQVRARDLLTDLAGSIANISQAFSLRQDPKNIVFLDYRELYQKYRDFHQNEWTTFFKDDWKIGQSVTLNLGVRWEWYGTAYEGKGLLARPIGGSGGLFGITGTGFGDWYRPGQRGSLTEVEFVGKHSPQPDKKLYPTDGNNFAPAVGVSWSLPWFGKDKTVLRAGYGWAYQGLLAGGGGLGLDIAAGLFPGVNQFANYPATSTAQLDIRNISLPIPGRAPSGKLATIPLTARNENISAYDNNLVTPYVQNFNMEIQRELMQNLTLEVRYIGSKGTKLYGGINLNTPIIEENGFLNAFLVTAAGGNAPLFDSMLRGLTINAAQGPVNGTTVTGSAALRQNTSTRGFLANGNPAGLANFLNTNSSFAAAADPTPGSLVRRAGLPENFFTANPQFTGATINGNPNNSTYHSMQIALNQRRFRGFTNQTTYTWSRSIGTRGFTTIDPRERGNKTLTGQHRTHDIRSNGTWELPFGPNRALLGSARGWVSRLIERWQLGGILSWNSGAPLSITGGSNSFVNNGTNYADLAGDFPKGGWKVTPTDSPGVFTYFPGFGQVNDPSRAGLTTLQSLQGTSTLRAITDANGNLILVNPQVGKFGNIGQNWIEGPGQADFDANLIKRVRIDETKELEFRLDAINVLNHPNFGNPTVSINSTDFGRIGLPAGRRQFVFNARLNF